MTRDMVSEKCQDLAGGTSLRGLRRAGTGSGEDDCVQGVGRDGIRLNAGGASPTAQVWIMCGQPNTAVNVDNLSWNDTNSGRESRIGLCTTYPHGHVDKILR